jgi:hypothetical protein
MMNTTSSSVSILSELCARISVFILKLICILNHRPCKCGNYHGLSMVWDPQYLRVLSVWPLFSPSVAHYEQWKILNAHNDMDSCIRPEGIRQIDTAMC